MNLRYTLTREMLIQFTEFMLLRGSGFQEAQWTARKRSALTMAFWLLCLIIYAGILAVSPGDWIRFMVLPALYFFGKSLYDIMADTGRAMKLVHERAVKTIDGRPADERNQEMDLRVLDDYFIVSSPSAQLALRPAQLRSIYYDDTLIYLFYRSDQAVLLPQTVFGGEELRNAFFAYLYRQNPALYQATHHLVLKELIPKEGLFDSPVKIVAGSLGLIGLGLVVFLFASPIIFKNMEEAPIHQAEANEEGRFDLTSLFSRVDDAESLVRLIDEEKRNMFWTPVSGSDPKKPIRCLLSLDLMGLDDDAPKVSAEQLATFSFLKKEYAALKPRLMPALLAALKHRQAEMAVFQNDDYETIPDLKSPEELAEQLTLISWQLHRPSRNGLALATINFKRNWDQAGHGNFGVLLLGDKIIYAGQNPEFYLSLDLDKVPAEATVTPAVPDLTEPVEISAVG